jgi:hypothetical protein
MPRVRFVLAFFFLFSMFAGLVKTAAPVLAADPESVGFVSGQWRIVAHQSAALEDDAALGIATGASGWIAIVADVTNVGVSVASLALGDFLVSGSNEEEYELSIAATAASNTKLKFATVDISGSISLSEDESQRVVLVFEAPADADAADLTLAFDDQGVELDLVDADKIDVAGLPAKTTWSVSQSIVADAEIGSIQIPDADGCYGSEAAGKVQELTGGSVWVESQGELVWYWDAATGHLSPLQASIVSGGFGAAVTSDGSVFRPWLASLGDTAKDADEGLWAVCKDAKGTWINPPTAAPPSAEEVRAEYQWVDVRDLAIRPDSFYGEKIAVEGEVFTVQAEEGFTGLQIWVTTPTGSQEAVVIAYAGDLIGVYEGTWVTVYGTGAGTFEGTNGFGASITQPMILADIVDY